MNDQTEQAEELEAIKKRIFDINTAYLVLLTENERLKSEIETADKLAASLRYDRDFWRDEVVRKGGNN